MLVYIKSPKDTQYTHDYITFMYATMTDSCNSKNKIH